MTHPSKKKGNRYEHELVRQARASGIEAKRAYGSNGEALGLHAEVDCVIGKFKVQAKRRKSIASFMSPSENVDVQAIRADFGETLIVMRFSDWLDLVKGQGHV